MSKNKWFGTDGVRGVANVFPMTAEFATRLAMAVSVVVCNKQHRVAIAKDTRVSGDMLEAALIAGFTSMGVDVIRLGVVPTPAVTTFVDGLEVDMAVMITASHNPYYDNGIKLIDANGDKFADEITAELEKLIEKNEFETDRNKIGKVWQDDTIAIRYAQIALNMAKKEKIFEGLKVVVDCANGCFSCILPQVLQKLGAEVVVLSNCPNGYNINENCGSMHVENMLNAVREQGADVGIAVDGDGDRVKMCDDKGQLIKSEQLMAFLAKFMEQNGENKGRAFASTKLSNTALQRYVEDVLRLKYVSTGVGERPVIKALKENGGAIGGEESGHIVLLDYAKSGDAMMTAIKVIEAIRCEGKKASEIFPLFEDDALYYQNFKAKSKEMVKDIVAHKELETLVEELSKQIDGHGRVVIHPSGTEPKIRVWVCGDDGNRVANFGQQLMSKIEDLAQRI